MNGNRAEVEKILKGLKGDTDNLLDPNVGKLSKTYAIILVVYTNDYIRGCLGSTKYLFGSCEIYFNLNRIERQNLRSKLLQGEEWSFHWRNQSGHDKR